MDHVGACVIGGGVVGLAVARGLAQAGRDVLVVDCEKEIGQGVSSRNSEVIHAGIYYPQGSLKARLCVAGKHLLYDYCESHGVGHANCGKLIVATCTEEEDVLEGIREKACANGVEDLEYWPGDRLAKEEPAVRATLALHSPSTGIVSSHELMHAMLGDVEDAGGMFAGATRVTGVTRANSRFEVQSEASGERFAFTTDVLVNAAGLGAQRVAATFDFLEPASIPPLFLCKGNYFTLSGRNPFSHLIYPVPEKSGAGLGVHATLDMGGQVKFGPDVEYIQEEDYAVSPTRAADYYVAVRRYFPSLGEGQLVPGYAGIRPKLQGPNDAPRDFVIQGPDEHGVQGLVQLYGIESPGLTSSLAIAQHVMNLLASH